MKILPIIIAFLALTTIVSAYNFNLNSCNDKDKMWQECQNQTLSCGLATECYNEYQRFCTNEIPEFNLATLSIALIVSVVAIALIRRK